MPQLSIIVPVYKVEDCLNKCIKSILDQTFTDFELILIDDGSPDNCPVICDEFAEIDDRIVVIHQENAGVSAARNAGLDIAKGKYIGFVDSDDYISSDMYQCMITAIENNKADLAICGYDYVDSKSNVTRAFKKNSPVIYNKEETFSALYDMPQTIRLGLVNKIFKSELIDSIRLPEDCHSTEDGAFLIQYLKNVKKSVFVRKPLYKNFEREGSATHGGLSISDLYKSYDIHKMMYDITINTFPSLKQHALAFFIDVCILKYKECKRRAESSEDKIIVKKMKKYIMEYKFNVLINKEIFWKTRVVYFIGAF